MVRGNEHGKKKRGTSLDIAIGVLMRLMADRNGKTMASYKIKKAALVGPAGNGYLSRVL